MAGGSWEQDRTSPSAHSLVKDDADLVRLRQLRVSVGGAVVAVVAAVLFGLLAAASDVGADVLALGDGLVVDCSFHGRVVVLCLFDL